jgi:hypothetical protein
VKVRVCALKGCQIMEHHTSAVWPFTVSDEAGDAAAVLPQHWTGGLAFTIATAGLGCGGCPIVVAGVAYRVFWIARLTVLVNALSVDRSLLYAPVATKLVPTHPRSAVMIRPTATKKMSARMITAPDSSSLERYEDDRPDCCDTAAGDVLSPK